MANSCVKFGFGGGLNEKKTTKNAEKASEKIEEEVRPPVKPFDISQGESDILKMAEEDLVKAKDSITRTEIDSSINNASNKIRVVISSIGMSPKDTSKMSENKKDRLIAKFRKEVVAYNKEKFDYQNKMTRFQVKVTELTGIIKEKTSIITKLKYIIIGLIVISVGVAAFVPGGAMLVSRFWKGGFSTMKIFTTQAYDSLTGVVGGINKAMADNKAFDNKVPGENRTYRDIIEDNIKMNSKDTDMYEDIKKGKASHLVDMLAATAKHVKKVA